MLNLIAPTVPKACLVQGILLERYLLLFGIVCRLKVSESVL